MPNLSASPCQTTIAEVEPHVFHAPSHPQPPNCALCPCSTTFHHRAHPRRPNFTTHPPFIPPCVYLQHLPHAPQPKMLLPAKQPLSKPSPMCSTPQVILNLQTVPCAHAPPPSTASSLASRNHHLYLRHCRSTNSASTSTCTQKESANAINPCHTFATASNAAKPLQDAATNHFHSQRVTFKTLAKS